MFDQWTAQAELRERVGDPDFEQVSNRKLDSHLRSALEWLAGELDCKIVTAASLYTLTAGEYRYPLPRDCYEILWVEWNSTKLSRGSLRGWTRDNQDWRNATSGTPIEFAEDRPYLVLYPPPAAGAITTDPTIDMSYISGGLAIGADGVPALTDLDMWVVVWKAADEFLGMHPSDEHRLMREAAREEWGMRLPTCRRHHNDSGGQAHARVQVWSSRSR